jgi:L-asparaginase II
MLDEGLTVMVTCDDGVWTAAVKGVPEATTQTRRLSELDPQVRQQLAELLARPARSFVLEYNVREGEGHRPDGAACRGRTSS